MDDSDNLTFVNIPVIRQPSKAGKSAAVITPSGKTKVLTGLNNNTTRRSNLPMMDTISNIKQGFDSLSPSQKQFIATNAAKVAKGVGEQVQRKFSGDGPTNVEHYTRHSSGYTLSKAPDPVPTNLDSGIKPNAYTSDVLDAIENKCSPLHVTCAKLSLPTVTTNKIYDYFLKIIVFDIQTKAQANVGFNLNINTDFTDVKVFAAINAVIYALQVYYWFTSIISYHSNYVNKNEGMIAIRRAMTPTMLEDLSQLGRKLADTPAPPRMLELIRYLSGNYFSGDNQGSPLIKICPAAGTNANKLLDGAAITVALANLSTTNNNQVYTLMRRAVPQWSPGPLKDVETLPKFDKNFLTIFANLPSQNGTVGFEYQPTIAAVDTMIAYNSFTNTLDGVAYAMTGMYLAGTGWLPSLMTPDISTSVNTRRSYYQVGGVTGFYDSDSYPYLARSRPESYQLNDAKTAILSLHLFGADKVLGVSSETVRETTNEVLDYLMSLDTIKNDVRRQFSNPTTIGKSKSRKRGK